MFEIARAQGMPAACSSPSPRTTRADRRVCPGTPDIRRPMDVTAVAQFIAPPGCGGKGALRRGGWSREGGGGAAIGPERLGKVALGSGIRHSSRHSSAYLLSPLLAAPSLPANRDIKAPRWNISRPVLVVLEQVFALEKFPSQLMRQRLSADLGVTPRQVNPRRPQPRSSWHFGGR